MRETAAPQRTKQTEAMLQYAEWFIEHTPF